MSSTLLRQWAMLSMIPRHPRKITASQLKEQLDAQGFMTTKRTIERDLVALSGEGFALVVDDRSRPHGWQWGRDVKILDIPGIEPQTALAFRLAEQFLKPLMAPSTLAALSPYFQQARQVLKGTSGNLSAWPSKVRILSRGQSLIPPKGNQDILMIVYEALFTDRQFRCHYRRRTDQQVKEYVVNPLGLVFRDGMIYLVCTLFEYTDVLQLALHRMSQAEPLETPALRPGNFDLDAYLKEGGLDFRLGGTLSLRLDLKAETAQHLAETPLSEDQQIEGPDSEGWVQIKATAPDTAQLRWWILGLGEQIRVRKPVSLRDEISHTLKRAARLYDA